jgi:hypothetical protein
LQPATIEELRAAPIPNIKHDATLAVVEMLITEAEDEAATALTE